MAQELYRRQEQLQNLDKVEPYGTNAASRAASETSNVYARMSASWGRLMGKFSNKLAIRAAQRTALKTDPATGVPMMPEGTYIGGLTSVDTYQRALDQRYEASLRSALKDQLAEAERNNLFNEEQFRQEAAVVVGAMHEKVAPKFQNVFNEMAAAASSEKAAGIAYRRAMEERREARSAARANAKALAEKEMLDAVTQEERDALMLNVKRSEEYKTIFAQEGELAANRYADVEYAKVFLDYAKTSAYLSKNPQYTHTLPEGDGAPEVMSDMEVGGSVDQGLGFSSPTFRTVEVTDDQGNVIQEVQQVPDPVTIELARAAETEAEQLAILQETAEASLLQSEFETSPAGLTLGQPALPSEIAPVVSDEQAEIQAAQDEVAREYGILNIPGAESALAVAHGHSGFAYNFFDPRGMPNRDNIAAYKEAENLSTRSPAFIGSYLNKQLTEKERDNFYEMNIPGSTSLGWHMIPNNVNAALNDPFQGPLLRAMYDGFLPQRTTNFLLDAASPYATPDAAMEAGLWWKKFGHAPTANGQFAVEHVDEAAKLTAYAIMSDTIAELPPEDRPQFIQDIQTNFDANTPEKMAAMYLLPKDADYPAVRNAIRHQLSAWNVDDSFSGRFTGSIGGLQYRTGDLNKIDPNRLEGMIDSIYATGRAMNTPDAQRALNLMMENSDYRKMPGIRALDGSVVTGAIGVDQPVALIRNPNADEVMTFKAIAAKKLTTLTGEVVSYEDNTLEFQPLGDGDTFNIWHYGENTGVQVTRTEINAITRGIEGVAMRTLTAEQISAYEQRIALMNELETMPTDYFGVDEDLPTWDRAQEIRDEVGKIDQMFKDGLSTNVEYIEQIGEGKWLEWFVGRP